jgi:hypothetical protein
MQKIYQILFFLSITSALQAYALNANAASQDDTFSSPEIAQESFGPAAPSEEAVAMGNESANPATQNNGTDTQEFGLNVSDDELSGDRGAYAPPINIANSYLSGGIYNSSVTGGNTGDNGLHDAFNNANGFISVIQNSGNNVIIQNAITATVTLQK